MNTRYTDHGGTDGACQIKTERSRQVELEGWTEEHDDQHDVGEMAMAAICYIRHAMTVPYVDNFNAYKATPPPPGWPWAPEWWKPKIPQRDLVRAGALIAAEVDRVEREIVERICAKGYPGYDEPSR